VVAVNRLSIRTSVGLLLALIVGCASLPADPTARRSLDEAVVFQPRRYPDGDWTVPPGVEEARFEAQDGVKLHGWFAPAKEPPAVVLFCHGNAGNVAINRQILDLFRDHLSASVLVFDYRGYGKSEGIPHEAGVLDDARAARRWLATRCGVNEQDVVLVGHSLGGGVAVDLAAREGARGLILWSTFTSLPDVAAAHLPLVPVRPLMRTRLDSQAKIRNYRSPLLQTHGDADPVVPFTLGRKLFAAANEPKQFVTVPGGGHNDPPSPELLLALDHFLRTLPPSN
jgi:fermentation-respiration switch protein FrsA (DUF1100 family)